ncbi:hypothetical protein A2U01_0050442, partial [Trifolium medium]|nr:hypothetical protein [Trifolium medium]
METTSHLFLSCNFAAQLWTWLGSLLQIVFQPNNFRELFENFVTGWSPLLAQIATAAVLHVLHVIWLARNSIRFNNATLSIHAAKIKVLTSVQLSANLMADPSNSDEQPILQQLAVTPCSAAARSASVKMVLWCSPCIGWMK